MPRHETAQHDPKEVQNQAPIVLRLSDLDHFLALAASDETGIS